MVNVNWGAIYLPALGVGVGFYLAFLSYTPLPERSVIKEQPNTAVCACVSSDVIDKFITRLDNRYACKTDVGVVSSELRGLVDASNLNMAALALRVDKITQSTTAAITSTHAAISGIQMEVGRARHDNQRTLDLLERLNDEVGAIDNGVRSHTHSGSR